MTSQEPGSELAVPVLEYARELMPLTAHAPAWTPLEVFKAIMGKEPLPEVESDGSIDPIIARLLAAPSLEQAIAQSGTLNIEDVLKQRVELSAPRWFPSDYSEGALAFCVVECVDIDDGVTGVLVVGSVQPQIVIWRAMVEGKLPLACRFVQSEKKTKSGFLPFSIVGI